MSTWLKLNHSKLLKLNHSKLLKLNHSTITSVISNYSLLEINCGNIHPLQMEEVDLIMDEGSILIYRELYGDGDGDRSKIYY